MNPAWTLMLLCGVAAEVYSSQLSVEQRPPPKNIIIFGETGSGKSSIVNMLMGRKVADTSNSAIGRTFEHQVYQDDTLEYNYYDTAGLSEGSQGRVTATEAITQLLGLLKSLKGGVSLLIFVTPKGRITDNTERNFKLFVDGICMNKVPVILMLTRCEMDEKMDQWWLENKLHFDRYGIIVNQTVSGCATNGEGMLPVIAEVMRQRYKETQQVLWKAVRQHALTQPWKMDSWEEWLILVIKRFWNTIAKFFGWSEVAYAPFLQKIFEKLGFSIRDATEFANKLIDAVTGSRDEL